MIIAEYGIIAIINRPYWIWKWAEVTSRVLWNANA